jgi:hypothetical protein
MEALTFDNVGDRLISAVPEIRSRYNEEFATYGDERPGQYLVFGLALNPFLFPLLSASERENEEVLRRVFSFFEEMAQSSDIQVVNLLWVEELEPLVTNRDLLARAWTYMGERTKLLAKETAKIWRSEQNVPAEG